MGIRLYNERGKMIGQDSKTLTVTLNHKTGRVLFSMSDRFKLHEIKAITQIMRNQALFLVTQSESQHKVKQDEQQSNTQESTTTEQR